MVVLLCCSCLSVVCVGVVVLLVVDVVATVCLWLGVCMVVLLLVSAVKFAVGVAGAIADVVVDRVNVVVYVAADRAIVVVVVAGRLVLFNML